MFDEGAPSSPGSLWWQEALKPEYTPMTEEEMFSFGPGSYGGAMQDFDISSPYVGERREFDYEQEMRDRIEESARNIPEITPASVGQANILDTSLPYSMSTFEQDPVLTHGEDYGADPIEQPEFDPSFTIVPTPTPTAGVSNLVAGQAKGGYYIDDEPDEEIFEEPFDYYEVETPESEPVYEVDIPEPEPVYEPEPEPIYDDWAMYDDLPVEPEPAWEPVYYGDYDFEEFADGGTSFGGMALVGEEGPELVDLPPGAQVMPAGITEMMTGRPTRRPRSLFRQAGMRAPSAQTIGNLLPEEIEVYQEMGRLAGIPDKAFEREFRSMVPMGQGGTNQARFTPRGTGRTRYGRR